MKNPKSKIARLDGRDTLARLIEDAPPGSDITVTISPPHGDMQSYHSGDISRGTLAYISVLYAQWSTE